jgi:uncharacterized protein
MSKLVAHLLVVLAVGLFSARALAFTPPPMTGHVTDTAGKLEEPERLAIDQKLEDYRQRTTNEIAVFIPATLDGDDVADVAFVTFRAWKLGVQGKDNGVLLVIAPGERKARIEVGRGVEGAITDLQANDIIRQRIRPHLSPGQENYPRAVEAATDGIIAALDSGGAGGGAARPAPAPSAGSAAMGLLFLLLVFLVPFILFITIFRVFTGAFTSHGPYAGRGWVSGSTWSNDSSWSSSSSDSGWSGGGDSGFTGGGGDTGGGGSSDSF